MSKSVKEEVYKFFPSFEDAEKDENYQKVTVEVEGGVPPSAMELDDGSNFRLKTFRRRDDVLHTDYNEYGYIKLTDTEEAVEVTSPDEDAPAAEQNTNQTEEVRKAQDRQQQSSDKRSE